MSRKYKFRDNGKLYFVSFSVVYWIDVFIRNEYKRVLIESWKYCKEHKGLEIYAFCIMTSHFHMIIGSNQEKLENIMRDMKSYTSTQLRKAIANNPYESRREWMLDMMQKAGKQNGNNNDWQFWQQNNHPIELFSPHIANQKLNYIHFNPVEAGFVDKEEEWLFSSARNYYGLKSVLDIELI